MSLADHSKLAVDIVGCISSCRSALSASAGFIMCHGTQHAGNKCSR